MERFENRRVPGPGAKEFAIEQQRLGRLWTFLGLKSDLAREGDWFRAVLGGHSVFVQRFTEGIRGFENLCAHRHYPLRTQNRGNGPVRCGFHHWQYDSEGLAVGIPKCIEQFGVPPRELGKKLAPIDIALCGELIFGRLRDAKASSEGLESYLGEGFPVLQTAFNKKSTILHSALIANANWKFGYEISLDDYHIVAVHPSTFGKQGYLQPKSVSYFKFGRHSAYFHDADAGSLPVMAQDCRAGTYTPSDYRIFQFFPNLVLVHFGAAGRWYVLLQQYVPISSDRTVLHSWLSPAAFGPIKYGRWRRPIEPLLMKVVMSYIRRIGTEDNAVCEQLQRHEHQVTSQPVHGLHEQRIVWFRQTYAASMIV